MKTYRTCYITEEQYQRILLNEDKMTDTIKRYIRANCPYDEQQLATPVAQLDQRMQSTLKQFEGAAFDTCIKQGFNLLAFLRLCFLKRFGIERGKGPSEYYMGLARIGLQELGMFTRSDTDNDITVLRDIAAYMHNTDNVEIKNNYDANFNGLSFNALVAKVQPLMAAELNADKDRLKAAETTNSNYRIVSIRSYEEASQYGKYTSWCVTHGKSHFDAYTTGGNRFYFCLQNGFENISAQPTENCPLDTYGLSMISVLVDTQGVPVHITTRWNHDHDGEDNPNLRTAQQFQEITHINFYNTFKPYTDEEQLSMGIIPLSKVQQVLDSDAELDKVFKKIVNIGNGFIAGELNNKWNIIDKNRKLRFDPWLDWIYAFQNGIAKIELDHKYNYINANAELILNPWVDDTYRFDDNYNMVELSGKRNLIDHNGIQISNIWFDDISEFYNGVAKVKTGKKYNCINTEGKLLSNTWFDYISNFKSDICVVTINHKSNIMDTNGQILSEVWFDAIMDFSDKFTLVTLDNKWNYINVTNGRLLSDTWFDDADVFDDGFGEVSLDGKWNYIKSDGNLLSNIWFDFVSDFYDGYAGVGLKNKYNIIDSNGKLIFKKWFKTMEDAQNSLENVQLNENKELNIRNIIQESLQRQKEELQNTNGIINLYQSTTVEKLEHMKKSPMFSAEYFGAAGGNLHTRAVYSNLDIQQTAKLNYGNVIVHLEFHATWDKILCINKYVTRKYCGGKNIMEQMKNFPKLYSLVVKNRGLVNSLNHAYESGDGESMAIVSLCDYLGSIKKSQMQSNGEEVRSISHKVTGAERQDFSHAILTEYGVEGFVYYGSFDGMCCIPLNADKVIPVEYAISQQRPADLNRLQWQSFNTQYDAGQVNHIQAFMTKYGNEYIWDRNERSYLNTILVKKRSDNLYYYLDTVSGKSVFPMGFYNARPFDPEFKKAWVQIYDDSYPMFIDKNGGLYRTIRGRQVSDLYLWMRQDNDFSNDDEENKLDDFSFLPGELD